MNWDAIGATGEIIGAIAVLITLVYLSIQIRQNTSAVQNSASDTVMSTAMGTALSIASSIENSTVWGKGVEDFNSLNKDEATQYRLYIISQLNASDLLFWHYRRGTLDKELWDRQEKWTIAYLNHSKGVELWDSYKHFLTEAFVRHVDGSLRDQKVAVQSVWDN